MSRTACFIASTSWYTSLSAPIICATSSSVRPWATSSLRVGMSMPYTFGYFTGGAAEAKITLLAPASRAICTISNEVVPRTMESSTISTFLPLNSTPMALSFWRTDFLRAAWPGMMKVRPT
ncbi:hypothetical protein D3C81_1318730 [compost metagenome]